MHVSFLLLLLLPPPADSLSKQKQQLTSLFSKMPHSNLCTLHYLTLHLHRVHSHHDANKMTSSNLAIVFWPTLMRPPLAELANRGKQLCWQLTMARLIEHPDILRKVWHHVMSRDTIVLGVIWS